MERKFDVVRMDTAAVVADVNQADAAAVQLDINRRCACIDTVFNDFFQGVGRAFDYFAGGDLVDEMVGQGGNAWHKVGFRCKNALFYNKTPYFSACILDKSRLSRLENTSIITPYPVKLERKDVSLPIRSHTIPQPSD